MTRILLAKLAALAAAAGLACAPTADAAVTLDFEGVYDGDTFQAFAPGEVVQSRGGFTARAFGTGYVVDGDFGPYLGDTDFAFLAGTQGVDVTADDGGMFDLLSFGALGYADAVLGGTLYYTYDGQDFETLAFNANAFTTFAPKLSGIVRAVFLGGAVLGGVDDIVVAAPAAVPLPAGAVLLGPVLLGAWTARRRAAA